MQQDFVRPVKEFEENVVSVNRISKKTKGGNQIRFSALVVIGDKKGRVGAGLSKSADVRTSIQKSIEYAKNHLITVPMVGNTIPFQIEYKYGAAKILLKPAPEGTGIIAGGPVRIVLELAGIKDVVAKMLGTKNKITNVYATILALEKISFQKERRENRKK